MSTPQGPNFVNGFKRATRFDTGLGAKLPEAYKKFWAEWKKTKPIAVHYKPTEEGWKLDEITHKMRPVQDVPLPLLPIPEEHKGIWGGEAVIKGFQKRHKKKRRVPHFWVPVLHRSVVYSEVLNKHLSVVVTERTLNLVHESQGFDHYLLKNLACNLRSELALKLKRKILHALQAGCPDLVSTPEHQAEVLREYQHYLDSYTPEEIEWYGLNFMEAIRKIGKEERSAETPMPHKIQFRSKLIEQLRAAGIGAVGGAEKLNDSDIESMTKLESTKSTASWLSRVNPFGRKTEKNE